MKATIDDIRLAYEMSKQCYEGKISRTYARECISASGNISENSANDYIYNLKSMLEGRHYTRTLSSCATKYFIERIHADYGENAYHAAIKATELHVDYYNSLGYGKRRNIERVLKELI